MDPQQQFCLKWNSFGNNLVTTFDNLFKSASLTDVTLFCEGVTFQTHRLILAACSKHFQDLFESAPLSPSILVILDGTSASNMSSLLEFMYKGEVHVAQESLSSFLKAAEYLQVKGLSIDHDKLITQPASHLSSAVLESKIDPSNSRSSSKSNKLLTQHNVIGKAEEGGSGSKTSSVMLETESMFPPTSSTLTFSSPYHLTHYKAQLFDHRIPVSVPHSVSPGYDIMSRKRPHRSPNDSRASVLRDGSKPERESPVSVGFSPIPPPLPPPSLPVTSGSHHFDSISLNLPPPSIMSSEVVSVGSFEQTAAVDKSPSPHSWPSNSNCAEDLRVKCEPVESGGSSSIDENSAERKYYVGNTSVGSGVGGGGSLDCGQRDRELNDRIPALPPLDMLSSSPSGSGKKLQCPYCERLYGYETNLRAHIRQRHQGIRVPCPFCTRTFTRNNTVRRHIAREHKTELTLKPMPQTQVQPHNNQQQ